MIKVKLIGATGYGGLGAIEILSSHPEAEIVEYIATADVGKKISDVFPHLRGFCDKKIIPLDEATEKADIVLFATPDGVGQANAEKFVNEGSFVIDYSGDFRFSTKEEYSTYASRAGKDENHKSPNLLEKSAYGLTEINRENITKARIVGNPGCFAVSAILGAYPAVKEGLIDTSTLIFDAKTGVSGAGKKPNATYHFPHRQDEMNAYKIGKHQHVVEVEKILSKIKGSNIKITFNTQVLPVVRGIMTCIYAKLNESASYEKILNAYKEAYENEPFVNVCSEEESASNWSVRGTNRAVLWVNVDRRTNTMIVVSHIDNLLKGQAGSAIQNMNLLFGLDEKTGLTSPAMYP